MNDLLTLLVNVMLSGESLKFSLAREDENVLVVVQPKLGEEPSNASPEVLQARAALAVPFWMKGTPAEVSAHLIQRLTQYAEIRQDLGGNYDALTALKEAAKEVAATRSKASAKQAAQPKRGVAKDTPATAAAVATDKSIAGDSNESDDTESGSDDERSTSESKPTPTVPSPPARSNDSGQPMSLFADMEASK